MTLGGGLVVAGVVWDSEAVVGGVCLDRMGDTYLGQRLLETFLLLVGERLVLNRPGHVDPISGRLAGYLRGQCIDLRHTSFESILLQLVGTGAEGVRFNHSRAGADILLMDLFNSIRFRHAELFETTIKRDPSLQKQSPGRTVSAKNVRLKFIEVLGPDDRELRDFEGSREMIDVLHNVLLLWKRGKVDEITKVLKETGFGNNDAFYRIAQAIAESLSSGSKEKNLLEGFLSGKDRISEDVRKESDQTRLFE